jgi:hypothetical protein
VRDATQWSKDQQMLQGGSTEMQRGGGADATLQPTNNIREGNGKGSKGEASGSRSKEEEQQHGMQQPASNRVGISKGSKEKASGSGSKEEEQRCNTQQPTNDGAGKEEGREGLASCMGKQRRGAVAHKATTSQ